MAKQVDTLDMAVRLKRGQVTLADVPEKYRPEVMAHLTKGEKGLIQRMRNAAPAVRETAITGPRPHFRFRDG